MDLAQDKMKNGADCAIISGMLRLAKAAVRFFD